MVTASALALQFPKHSPASVLLTDSAAIVVTSVAPIRLVMLTLTLRCCFAAVAGEILPAELRQLLMVFRLSAINRFIVSPVFDLQKVKPADLCAGKFPLAVFFFFRFQPMFWLAGWTQTLRTTTSNKTGQKSPRPLAAPPTRRETMEAFPDATLSNRHLKGAFFPRVFLSSN